LDIAALMAGRCPKCDTPIVHKSSKTVQDTVYLGDVARAETTPDMPDIVLDDESLELEPLGDDLSRDSHSIAGDGTIELPRPASDEETEAMGSAEDETEENGDTPSRGSKTVSDRENLTIEMEPADPGKATTDSSDPPGKGSTHSFVGDATIDLELADDDAGSDALGSDDRATTDSGLAGAVTGQETTDSDDIHATTDSALQKLPTQWRGSYSSDTSPGHTIRQTGTVTGFKSSLPIKSRFISERRQAVESAATI
jgi:hypothetical protein